MNSAFSRSLSLLRQEKGISQRIAANDLGISQALLSHYENGIREPGLAFVTRACDYYNVSADFMLGRTLARDGAAVFDAEALDACDDKNDNILRGSVIATLYKKLLVNSVCLVFDLLGKTGRKDAIRAASDYLGASVYRLYRYLYRAEGTRNEDFFSVPTTQFIAGVSNLDMFASEYEYVSALEAHAKDKGAFPTMSNDDLMREYPGQYQSLLQVVHATGQRVGGRMSASKNISKQN
jgi:transcriptional regulator with XRE-family HTH domain